MFSFFPSALQFVTYMAIPSPFQAPLLSANRQEEGSNTQRAATLKKFINKNVAKCNKKFQRAKIAENRKPLFAKNAMKLSPQF